MHKINNIQNILPDFMDDPDFETGLNTKYLGRMGGSEKIYVNIDYVKPGFKSAKYHSHSLMEEFFLIRKGKGTLRLNGKMIPVKEGDFFSKPAGKDINHQFINDSDEVLEILDCGTIQKNDVIFYPDENITLDRKTGKATQDGNKIEGWTTEPNP